MVYEIASVQTVNVASVFIGVGGFIVMLAVTYLLLIFARAIRSSFERDMRYDALQSVLITRIAKRKGIDLEKEMEKLNLFRTSKFRKRLQLEMFNELFGEEKKKEEKPKE